MQFIGTGTLVYDPVRKEKSQPWWAILECDPDYCKYYTKLWEWETGVKLHAPRWGSHCSVVKGEEPPNKEFWGRYQNQPVQFVYTPEELLTDGDYVWLRVLSQHLQDIRLEMGLSQKPFNNAIGFHITVGRHTQEKYPVRSGNSVARSL
jgi:hypothetical protein